MSKPDFREGQAESMAKPGEKLSFFQGNQEQLFQSCPERIEAPFSTLALVSTLAGNANKFSNFMNSLFTNLNPPP